MNNKNDRNEPGYTRWLAKYEGVLLCPEVYAATETRALEKAIDSFKYLCNYHNTARGGKGDVSFIHFFPITTETFDATKVSVVDIGLPIFVHKEFEIKQFETPLMDILCLDYHLSSSH